MLCVREALYGHSWHSGGIFIDIEQSQNETDLDETLFTHAAAIEDLNGTSARLSLSSRSRIDHVPAVASSVFEPPSRHMTPDADFGRSASS